MRAFGGVDMVVLNAGIFPSSQPLQEVAAETWKQTMTVNVEAPLRVLQLCHPLLRLAGNGGRIVVIGSRNVFRPGPGAPLIPHPRLRSTRWRASPPSSGRKTASASIRCIRSPCTTRVCGRPSLAARAKAYNMTVEQYRRKNLLKTEVASRDVAELAAEMCGLFAKTTAAQVPVDGGNERVV